MSLLIAATAVSLGCSGKQVSGQTGSPGDGAPDYTSPTRFTPSDGGSTGTDSGGNGFIDLLNWVFPPEPTELVQLDGETLVVFAPPEEYTGPTSYPRQLGLQLYDASSDVPTKLGEVAIGGWPHRMHLDTDAVNLAILQPNTEEYDSLPEQSVPRQLSRLLRIDRSDPSAPEVVGSMDIEGTYARSVQVGSRIVVVSQLVEPIEAECNPDGGPTTDDIDLYEPLSELPDGETRVVSYEFSGGEFNVADSVTLDGLFQVASVSSEGLVLHHVELIDEETFLESLLLLTTGQDAESLTPGKPITLAGSVGAALWQDGVLSTAQVANGSAELRVYDASDISALTSLGSTSLRLPGIRIVSDGGSLLLVDPSLDTGVEGPATLIDIADPASPNAVELAGATAAEFTPNGVVGVAQRDTGHVTLQLWDATDPAAPVLSAETATDWPFTYSTGPHGHLWHYYEDAELLLLPYGVYLSDTIDNRLGLARVTQTGFDVLDAQPTSELARNIAASPDVAFALSPAGLDVIPSDGSVASSVALYPARNGRVVHEVRAGVWDARIFSTETQTLLELSRDAQDEPTTFDLSHFAEELIVVGDRLVALGLSRYSDCDYAEIAEVELRGQCPMPNVNGISVVSLGDDPELEWEQTLPTEYGAPSDLPDDTAWSVKWYGYLEADGESLILPATQRLRCESQAACDALGIQAEEGASTPGSPGCDPNGECPDVEPVVTITHSGTWRMEYFYRLDLSGDPSLTPELEAPEEFEWRYGLEDSPLNLAGEVFRDGDDLGFWHYEYVYEEGETQTDEYEEPLVRHFFDHYFFDDQGALQFDSSINIPGIPLSFAGNGDSLITIEPLYQTDGIDAQVHRLSLRDGGAYIDETLNLGPGFRDHTVIGDRAYLLFGPEARCDEEPTSRVFTVALNDEELSAAPALELPGENWAFAWWERPWDDDTVLLRGGPAETSGRLELDVSDAGEAPVISSYYVVLR